MRSALQRAAFTLVELLVVVGILLILIAMVLPAVQRVREVANRMECADHLRRIGKGTLLFIEAHQKYFPNGGANAFNPENPTESFPRLLLSAGTPASGSKQGWGWMYQILPYVEYESLWNLRRSPGTPNPIVDQMYLFDYPADDEIRKTPIPLYFCPSRRSPQLVLALEFPWDFPHAACDYAGNAGPYSFINNLDMSEHGQLWGSALWLDKEFGLIVQGSSDPRSPDLGPQGPGQLIMPGNRIHVRDVTDGLSNTLLASEKAYNADRWGISQFGDRKSFCYGFGPSTCRTGALPPVRDFHGTNAFGSSYPYSIDVPSGVDVAQDCFGSAHPYSMNALFADGSVRPIKYELPSDPQIRPVCNGALSQLNINPLPSPPNPPNSLSLTLFQRLCHRSDGGTVNLSLLDE